MTLPTDAPAAQSLSMAQLREQVDARLAEMLPMPAEGRDAVACAMRNAVLGPGKRVRPLLMLATAQGFGLPPLRLIDGACALEMVHAASLVLDDLPCMDDAAERRGLPTIHRRFGEEVAVLASVALLSQSWRVLAGMREVPAEARLRMIEELSDAVGAQGLVSGQWHDLSDDPRVLDETALAHINDLKTGSLFRAALTLPALAAGAQEPVLQRLAHCAMLIGQAFQLKDDLEDSLQAASEHANATPARALATACVVEGEDAGKATLVGLLGRDAARDRFLSAATQAQQLLLELFPGDDHAAALVKGLMAGFAKPADLARPAAAIEPEPQLAAASSLGALPAPPGRRAHAARPPRTALRLA